MAHYGDYHHARTRFGARPLPAAGESTSFGRATSHPAAAAAAISTTWTHVSFSVVSDLPPVAGPDGQRCSAVVAFVDRLSRQARFLPAPDAPPASSIAALFTTHVQGRLGPPQALLWDRDLAPSPAAPGDEDHNQAFWAELCALLRVPATPLLPAQAGGTGTGSTASCGCCGGGIAARRVIEQLIRAHAHHLPDTWPAFLAVTEAAFNGTHPVALSAAPSVARHPSLSLGLTTGAGRLVAGGGLLLGSAPASPRGMHEAPSPSSSSFSSFIAAQHLKVREIQVRAQMELQAARARYGYTHRHSSSSSSSSCSGGVSSHSSSDHSGADGGSPGSSLNDSSNSNAAFSSPRASSVCSSGSGGVWSPGGSVSSVSGVGSGSISSGGSISSSSTSSGGDSSSGGGSSAAITAAAAAAVSAAFSSCCISPSDPQFRVGDRVRLSTANLCLPDQPETRLRPGFLGPLTVAGVVSPAAYRLDLPPSLDRLYPVFHVSRLLAWSEPGSARSPPPAAAAAAAEGSPKSAQLTARHRGLDVAAAAAGGDVVLGVQVSQVGRVQPTVMFHIRWAAPRPGGQQEGWEPYSAVERLPAVRAYLRGSEWREWRKTEAAKRFLARWPERMPRLVRFEV